MGRSIELLICLWGGILFQDSASVQAIALDLLHDYVMGLSIIVLVRTGIVICLQAVDSWMWGAFADYPALEFV